MNYIGMEETMDMMGEMYYNGEYEQAFSNQQKESMKEKKIIKEFGSFAEEVMAWYLKDLEKCEYDVIALQEDGVITRRAIDAKEIELVKFSVIFDWYIKCH